jgi:hypothetical protein
MLNLPLAERLELVQELCGSIAAERERHPLPPQSVGRIRGSLVDSASYVPGPDWEGPVRVRSARAEGTAKPGLIGPIV